jgi:hypothetical protein
MSGTYTVVPSLIISALEIGTVTQSARDTPANHFSK